MRLFRHFSIVCRSQEAADRATHRQFSWHLFPCGTRAAGDARAWPGGLPASRAPEISDFDARPGEHPSSSAAFSDSAPDGDGAPASRATAKRAAGVTQSAATAQRAAGAPQRAAGITQCAAGVTHARPARHKRPAPPRARLAPGEQPECVLSGSPLAADLELAVDDPAISVSPVALDEAPTRPFQHQCADLYEDSRRYFLVAVDPFSGWQVVRSLGKTATTAQLKQELRSIFRVAPEGFWSAGSSQNRPPRHRRHRRRCSSAAPSATGADLWA
ncbi:hypothetical protein FJT64_015859 [Amphibalanus amphitrite]|uniref:Uncharacterized protein n=1 Tax=Amphibalanus amphitrite TaxID=1232801 RepID=A0A6A4XC98_AMPAM|nr:hypothetical protein FJT64_015859 [Amphibalanus amphitrite]